MTPIKVGDFQVETLSALAEDKPQKWYVVRPVDDFGLVEHETYLRAEDGVMSRLRIDEFATLPMALRVAAELAGIERQRVNVHGFPGLMIAEHLPHTAKPPKGFDGRGYMVPLTAWHDGSLQRELGDVAHEYARERYAALGGAA